MLFYSLYCSLSPNEAPFLRSSSMQQPNRTEEDRHTKTSRQAGSTQETARPRYAPGRRDTRGRKGRPPPPSAKTKVLQEQPQEKEEEQRTTTTTKNSNKKKKRKVATLAQHTLSESILVVLGRDRGGLEGERRRGCGSLGTAATTGSETATAP